MIDYCLLLDATASMESVIKGSREYAVNELRGTRSKLTEGVVLKAAAICFRDPIDCYGDEHVALDFTDHIQDVDDFLKGQEAKGGGDTAEDWVGALDMTLKLSWRDNSDKYVTIVTDSPPHGKLFSKSDSHHDEDKKLIDRIKILVEKQINVMLIGVHPGVENAMLIFKEKYDEFGGKSCIIKCIHSNIRKEIGHTLATGLYAHVSKESTSSFRESKAAPPTPVIDINYSRPTSPPPIHKHSASPPSPSSAVIFSSKTLSYGKPKRPTLSEFLKKKTPSPIQVSDPTISIPYIPFDSPSPAPPKSE